MAFSLNPKKEVAKWRPWWQQREWTSDSYWEYQVHWFEQEEKWWNGFFHTPLARLASKVMGWPAETRGELQSYAREHMVFMEVCPYASERWAMDPDTVLALCANDIGFQTEEEMVRILVSEAEPALILVNGMDAVKNFERVYGDQVEWKLESYKSESKPGKPLKH